MSEDDPRQPFHRRRALKPQKKPSDGLPVASRQDEFIMDTNSSSITSKRSVEKLYYPDQASYFRYFVKKFQRRSPLINRGYWLRMKAIEKTVETFLNHDNGKTKVVVNLGCGYDPLPFQFLGEKQTLCRKAIFVDVDYPDLVLRKLEVIERNSSLADTVPNLARHPAPDPLIGESEQYKVIGCDLKDVSVLDRTLRRFLDLDGCSVAILFVAEVSVAYMEKTAANLVLKWAGGLLDAKFCLLEQHLPDGSEHPFARTMLQHFEKLRTPLHAIGTIDDMRQRFTDAGWRVENIDVQPLWEVWSDPRFLSPQERSALDTVEPFDEWEEFALFASHYFLLLASTSRQALQNGKGDDSKETRQAPCNARLTCQYHLLDSAQSRRRFGAAVTSPGGNACHHYGGIGLRERIKSADAYHSSTAAHPSSRPAKQTSPPDMPAALMCHTITTVGGAHLLVGGRTAPDKASKECWLLKHEGWQATHNLPLGLYRHMAAEVLVPTQGSSMGRPRTGVLVFGGKLSDGSLTNSWMLYTPKHGWQTLDVGGDDPRAQDADALRQVEPRFGGNMIVIHPPNATGVVFGGMRADGTIIDDCWTWTLDHSFGRPCIKLSDGRSYLDKFGSRRGIASRFGAQTVQTAGGTLLIGGVMADRLMTAGEEVLNLDMAESIKIDDSPQRPLLVGMSLAAVHQGVLVLGGGATCFSFGTCHSQSGILASPQGSSADPEHWTMAESRQDSTLGPEAAKNSSQQENGSARGGDAIMQIEVLQSPVDFEALLHADRPVVLDKLDLGECTARWTVEYLKTAVGASREVIVHDSTSANMSFTNKNFTYRKMAFGQLVDAASGGAHVYMRGLSSDKPADAATSLEQDYSSLAGDFALPTELQYVRERAHSSVLRISGAVNMWLHYDVMANVLCQVRGNKDVVLFAPGDVRQLGLAAGASSSTLDVFAPAFSGPTRYEARLEAGQVLLIPPLWLHATRPAGEDGGLGVAVNVFFRDDRMEQAYAVGRDVYGNRDIAAYERGRRDVQRVAGAFDGLPASVRRFYLSRLVQELEDAL